MKKNEFLEHFDLIPICNLKEKFKIQNTSGSKSEYEFICTLPCPFVAHIDYLRNEYYELSLYELLNSTNINANELKKTDFVAFDYEKHCQPKLKNFTCLEKTKQSQTDNTSKLFLVFI